MVPAGPFDIYKDMRPRRLAAPLAAALAAAMITSSGCALRGQRFEHFRTPLPIAEDQILIIGFLGGRKKFDTPNRGVTRLAQQLRDLNLPGVNVEVVENRRRYLALELIRKALDTNGNGWLEPEERTTPRVILYGQSFGGAAVVKLARDLHLLGVPVLLSVQVDSVGRGDGVIPGNVRMAVNLFQSDGLFIRGEAPIRAADPQRTRIENIRFHYDGKDIPVSDILWIKYLFLGAHTKMDFDPAVWDRVEQIIVEQINQFRSQQD